MLHPGKNYFKILDLCGLHTYFLDKRILHCDDINYDRERLELIENKRIIIIITEGKSFNKQIKYAFEVT